MRQAAGPAAPPCYFVSDRSSQKASPSPYCCNKSLIHIFLYTWISFLGQHYTLVILSAAARYSTLISILSPHSPSSSFSKSHANNEVASPLPHSIPSNRQPQSNHRRTCNTLIINDGLFFKRIVRVQCAPKRLCALSPLAATSVFFGNTRVDWGRLPGSWIALFCYSTYCIFWVEWFMSIISTSRRGRFTRH